VEDARVDFDRAIDRFENDLTELHVVETDGKTPASSVGTPYGEDLPGRAVSSDCQAVTGHSTSCP
jgi:hypothetical protein